MALTARGLKVKRSGFELDVASLRAAVGGLALVGPNGAGKTTLLLALQDLLPHAGSIERPARSAGVFAQPAFLRGSVLWNVLVAARRSENARALLESVGLADLAQERVSRLSSGQRQRLALARALAVEPSILFLDEAFANIDADGRVRMREVVRAYARGAPCTVILATQNYADVAALAERVALLDGGKLVMELETRLMPSSTSPYLQALLEERSAAV